MQPRRNSAGLILIFAGGPPLQGVKNEFVNNSVQESLQELPTNKALNLGMSWDAFPYRTDSAFHEAWAHKEFKIICTSICPRVSGKLAETPLQKKINTQTHKKLLSGIVCRELAGDNSKVSATLRAGPRDLAQGCLANSSRRFVRRD